MPYRIFFTWAVSAFALCMTAVAAGAVGLSPTERGASAGLRDLGPATGSQMAKIAVMLKYRHDAELEALVDAQADRHSPFYGRYLTGAQFNAYFAPTPADYARVIGSLQRAGFTVTATFPNRTIVAASAPVPVAARYFATRIDSVLQPGVGVHYMNVRPETIPADLRDVVYAVTGLSSVRVAHVDYVRGPRQIRPAVLDPFSSKPLYGPDGGYGPLIFTRGYNLPAGTGKTGTGRASAVAIDADFLDSDLAAYLSYFKVTRTGPATKRILVDGGPPAGITPDSIETTLDVETIVSLAPGTALYVYEFPSFGATVDTTNIVETYNKIVSDGKVDTVNSSFGLCELAFGKFPAMADKVALQGGAKGITFHASTGDNGPYTYGCSSTISVDAPAIAPHFAAVGGTAYNVGASGNRTSEVVWNDGSGATGGGVSVTFKVPSYQVGVKNLITSGRNDPDLSFDASPFTGESLYYNGTFQGPIGGTSLSSPIFGAAMTEIAQIKGTGAGYVNPALYSEWATLGYHGGSKIYFHDITVGGNGQYNAKVGYDQASGIGTMNVANFGVNLP